MFYRWRNTGLEGLSNLLKVIYLEIGIAMGSVWLQGQTQWLLYSLSGEVHFVTHTVDEPND